MNETEPTIAAMEVPTLEKQVLIVEDEIVFATNIRETGANRRR